MERGLELLPGTPFPHGHPLPINPQSDKKKQRWKCRASIPVPVACEATALPFELHSLLTGGVGLRGRGGYRGFSHTQAVAPSENNTRREVAALSHTRCVHASALNENYLLPPIPTGSRRPLLRASRPPRRPSLEGDGLYLRPAAGNTCVPRPRPTAIQSLNCTRRPFYQGRTRLAADIPSARGL